MPAQHDERCSENRRNRRRSGKGRLGGVEHHARRDDHDTYGGKQVAHLRPEIDARGRGDDSAHHQLPGAGREQIEVGARVMARRIDREREREPGDQQERLSNVEGPLRQQPQQQWVEDVELLFHGQRPRMQQRLRVGLLGEITYRFPEEYVGPENRDARERPSVVLERFRRVDDQRGERRDKQDERQRRKYAPDPPLIEIADGISTLIERTQQDSCNQETGDDEEYVYANKPPRETRDARVEQDHR